MRSEEVAVVYVTHNATVSDITAGGLLETAASSGSTNICSHSQDLCTHFNAENWWNHPLKSQFNQNKDGTNGELI